MTDKGKLEAIEELIARLEKATGPDRELDLDIWCEIYAPDAVAVPLAEQWNGPQYTSSIDSALSLVPEGFHWQSYPSWEHREFRVYKTYDGRGPVPDESGEHIIPAIALCIAALKAIAAGDKQ